MSWLFAYYVESRYGYLYREPTPWFNVDIVKTNCPEAVFHCSETHKLHKYGNHLKNFGLRTCMIIETPKQEEAVVLKLMNDQVINNNHGTKSREPLLQLILENPDWNALDDLCKPLDTFKRLEAKRRGDVKVTNLLQKQIDRINGAFEDLDGLVSDSYRDLTMKYIDDSYLEIERIRAANRAASRQAGAARRALTKKLISYSQFILSPNLK